MADTTQGDLERANAIENLESTLAIIRRDIFLVEDQLNQGGPVDSQRIREIDGLIGNLRSGNLKDFHLKGESVDVLNFKKEEKQATIDALRKAGLEEGEGIIKDLKVQGTIDRNIAERLGYFHQTANALCENS